MTHSMNKEQQRAVYQVDGRVLILAGAGSGKTRVLTYRMAHLIDHLNVPPSALLGLTFTNKAAAEMRHRLQTIVGEKKAKQVTLCTFHSFCLELLRREIHRLGYTKTFSLYNEHDVRRLINAIVRELLGREGDLPSLAPTTSMLTAAASLGLKSQEICDPHSKWHQTFTRQLHSCLQSAMRAYNAVDLDGLLSLSVQLFEEHPTVLATYQERFRYIMIDEYQDTNPIQYRLTSLLAEKYGNLCVVGDDDQSIYGWRGADMQNILNFNSQVVIKLEQNYRSTNSILRAANSVISHNLQRREKSLWSECGEGQALEIFCAPDESKEAEAVVRRMLKLKDEKQLKWKDMAILYRSNSLSRQFEIALSKQLWRTAEKWVQGIPYRLYGAVEFYERREVKDLFAYLRLIVNPQDEEALLRVINQPRRGIGESTLDALTAYNRQHKQSLWHVIQKVCQGACDYKELQSRLSSKSMQGLHEFIDIMATTSENFNKLSWSSTLNALITRIDYKKAIREEVKSTQMRNFKWENVLEFINAAAQFEDSKHAAGEKPTLSDFVQQAPLDNTWKGDEHTDAEDKVHMLTFHSSKGLEFPACFLVGMEEGIIPHAKSMLETGLEEERRLMYVAITRAMRHLHLSMAMSRLRMGQKEACRPSSFLAEIPKELLHMTDWRN